MAGTIRENTGKPGSGRQKTEDGKQKNKYERLSPVAGPPSFDSLTSRMMPESLAAEAAVLGSMIIDPICIGHVVEMLSRDSFYRVEHQLIYDAIISLYEKNKGGVLDAFLVRNELEKQNQLENVGGHEYIRKILDSVPTTANIEYYCDIVKDKQLHREMIQVANEILGMGYAPEGEAREKIDEAEQRIFALVNKKTSGLAVPAKDLMTQVYEDIERRKENIVTGLATGFIALDQLTCGLQNGDMIIIAGRPSMGKTALALNIAENIGVVEKLPVAIFSLEMSKKQLAERLLSSNSQVDAQLMRKGMLKTEDYTKLVEGCSILSAAPIFIDDTSLLSPLELRAKARRLKSQHDIRCIFVDYLQLMHLDTYRIESRQQEITTISRYLKALAHELNVPVVALSQLNRAPEGREDHRPRMSDLRESGSIEQDADVVMMLHREDYYKHQENKEVSENAGTTIVSNKDEEYKENTAELIIAKQRNGPTDTVKMVFRKNIMRFESASFVGVPSTNIEQTGSGVRDVPF
ncbi:MAG: replicative DNA helicase [Sedimentisphaerales bacterium]|jgi:replicative DNA helicase